MELSEDTLVEITVVETTPFGDTEEDPWELAYSKMDDGVEVELEF